MSGERLRLASVSVLGGSLHGRRRDLEEVVAEVLIGSDPDCHLVVDLPSISPIHARLWTDLDQAEVQDTRAPRGVYVNTKRVEGQAILRPGDMLWLGPPQDPGSVCIRCRFEPWVEVLPGGSSFGDVADDAVAPAEDVDETTAPPEPGAEPLDAYEAVVVEGEGDAAVLSAGAEELLASASVAAPIEPEPEPVVPGRDEAPEPSPDEAVPMDSPPIDAPADGDPFFVGETDAAASDRSGADGVITLDRPAAVPAATEPPAPETVPSAPDQAADDWAIAEPPSTPVEPLPAPDVSDEFFVSEESVLGAAAFEPEVDSPAIRDTAQPPGRATPRTEPATETAPSFGVFGEFEPESTTVAAEEPVAPIELVPAWEAPPAPPPTSAPIALPALPATSAPAPVAPVPAAASAAAAEGRRPGPPSGDPARPRPATASPKRPPGPTTHARGGTPPRRPGARPAARPAGAPPWLKPLALGLVALAVLAAAGFGAWKLLAGGVRVAAIEPARVRVGQRAVITGRGFSPDAAGNVVTFDDHSARVLSAQAGRLEVEVPEVPAESGGELRVSLVVRAGAHASPAVPVTVIQGPRLHGLSPEAALPGEEVLLAGAGWGLGATVRFGSAPAQVVAADATSIRAIVPAEAGAPGTRAPVVVTVAGVESNAAPFVVGRLPVVTGIVPSTSAPGDAVQISGLGFDANAALNDVRIGGAPALVLAATGDSLKVVVPRLSAADPARAVEVRVPGSTSVGAGTLQAAPMPDVVELRFVAEPFAAAEGRPYAVVATGLGPAFVLAASGGQTAAARAADAAQKLNGAREALRTTLGLTFEARGYDTSPSLGLAGNPDALLTVTAEDAAAYNEGWPGLKGRGGPVTRGRLLRWWEAIARDIVLATVRGERPRFAAALAPEGRALGQLYDAARKPGLAGLAQQAVTDAKPALRDAVRLVALRVPAQVEAPAAPIAPGAPSAPAAAAPAVARMPAQGTLRGSEVEEGQRRYFTIETRGGGGTIAYEGGITFTLPLQSLERGRDRIRFSVPLRGGMRHYSGKWDGEKVEGAVSTDAAGRNVVATFELRPR